MAKPKKTMKGVTCKNGYWYARIDRQVKYCGKGDKGHKLAKTARMKWEVRMWLQIACQYLDYKIVYQVL